MSTTRVQMIIETLRDNPDRKFTARELAKEFLTRYPDEIAEKRINPRYDTEEKLITQLAATLGRAATEEQLKLVNETATMGWNISANGATPATKVAPGNTVDFSSGNTNIAITQDTADGKKLIFTLAKDLTGLNSAKFVNDDGEDTIYIDGREGQITGLSNKTLDVAGFATLGRAATEEQLKLVNDTATMGWNISANGLESAKVAPGGLVDFGNTDGNILISRTGTNITHNLSADLKIDNSITVGDTFIDKSSMKTKNLTVTEETKLGNNFWVTKDGDTHYNGPITSDTHIVNKKYVDESISNVSEIANKGWNVGVNGLATEQVKPGDSVDFGNADGNIVVSRTGKNIKHDLSPNLKIGESITIGGDTTNQTVIKQGNVTTNTLNVGGGTMVVNEGSVSIKEGTTVNMGGNRITNVAPGVNNGDAVTVSQLKAVTGGLDNLRGDLSRIDRDARAGTASAMANLPQAYLPGKSMFAIATGGHRGQQGYAAGLSTISEDGNWVLKGSVSGNSRGHVTYGAGVGYQW